MKILILTLSLVIFSCANKKSLEITEASFLGLSFTQKKTSFNSSTEPDQTINGINYSAYKIEFNNYYTILLVDKKSDRIVESIKFYNQTETLLTNNRYSTIYQPKCESKLMLIKYNLDKKLISLTKSDKTIFEGESNLILDRIADDKNKKCLNRWNH